MKKIDEAVAAGSAVGVAAKGDCTNSPLSNSIRPRHGTRKARLIDSDHLDLSANRLPRNASRCAEAVNVISRGTSLANPVIQMCCYGRLSGHAVSPAPRCAITRVMISVIYPQR